jgi:hypothetical protein
VQSSKIAKLVVMKSDKEDPTKGATHYHRSDILPWWTKSPEMKFLFEFEGNKYYKGW